MQENLKNLFAQTPEMFCILNGPDHVFEFVNKAHIKALGFDATGMAVRTAQPESVEVHGILDEVYNTGVTAHLHEIPVTLGKEIRYFDLTYAAKKNTSGIIDGIMILGNEVTERVLVDKQLQLERNRLYKFIEQIPAAMAVIRGENFVFELANSGYQKLISNRDLIGKTLLEAIPELSGDLIKILKEVIQTGKPFIAQEFPVLLDWDQTGKTVRYIDIVYEPITLSTGANEGILVFAYDVTDKFLARQKVISSESKFKNLIESMPQIVFIADAQGKVTSFNQPWYDYIGIENVGKDIHHPEDIEKTTKLWNESILTGNPYTIEYRLRRHDGEYRWHLGRAVPIRDFNGNISEWFGTDTDIHDIKLLQDKYTLTESNLQIALESGGMGLWFLDLATNKITATESLSKILGTSPINGELSAINQMVIHPEDLNENERIWKAAVENRNPYHNEFRIIRPSGELRWISSSGQVRYNAHGKPLSVSGVTYDISDSKFTEQKLMAALKSRDEFLSIASHELKTPLTSLKLRIQNTARQLSKEGINNFSLERALDIINKNNQQVDRLVRLVDDMLDISRVQSGKLSYHFVPHCINKIVLESFGQFKDQFEISGTELFIQIDAKEIFARVDRDRMEQVLTNILTNALRYGDNKPVTIYLSQIGNKAVIKVKDQGRGISPTDTQRVFAKFERIISANEVSGLGIGLFISKEIVEAHGGRIWVESELKHGSSFFVELPLI